MKLKKLILSGFKSFADRTEFDFDDGISCIVGPNGCGKSNVVDAVKWVLGEQSAKSLRGAEMQDVIFNGAASRKASGHSTVTLVFDNSSGILQLSQEHTGANGHVAVTRRLFRSGQSEYLINKVPCRLRDIREMFMDTGIGSGAYGVIEQGQVSAFLQASHDERRKVFDEAAGISKYKSRKKEALRKLERVDQNLLRLMDVLGEVERRLRSIKYQAGKARNYQAYSQQLADLKSLHFQSQYHLMSKQRAEIDKQLNGANDSLSAITTRIDRLSAAHSASQAESEDLERTLRDLRVRTATLGGQITMWQERGESHQARVKELGDEAVVIKSRCESLEAKVSSLEEEVATRTADKQRVEQMVHSLSEKYEVLLESHQAGELEISKIQADLEDERNGTMDLIRRAGQLHNEAQTHVIRRDNFDGQRTKLGGRAREIAAACDQLVAERAAVEAKRCDVEETLNATRERLEEANTSSTAAAGDEQELQQQLSQARQDRSGLEARAQTLSQMAERLDGVRGGARRLLEARRKGGLACIVGMLGDFIQADVDNARLIEAALGGADQQLIANSFREVSESADEIKRVLGDNGAVEIWCLDSMASEREAPLVAHPKVIARAIDWVRFEEHMAPAVHYALGNTLVVQTLADAREVAGELGGDKRFLTRDGDVLECDGRVRLGWANSAAGLITRRSELDKLREQLEALGQRIAELEGCCQTAHSKREHLEELLKTLRTAVYEDSMELTSAKGRLAQIDNQIAELKREEPLVAGELQQLTEDILKAEQAQQHAREKAAELEQLNKQRQEQLERLEEQMIAAKGRRDDQSGEMTEVKVALGQAREKASALSDSLLNLKRQREQAANDLQAGRADITANAQRRAEAAEAIGKAKDEAERLYVEHEKLTADAQDIEESRIGLKERIDQIARDMAEQRRQHDQSNKTVSACMARISEADANISNLITRASEDMGLDLLERFESYTHDEERDWEAVAEEIRQLDGKIKRLGNVNLDAIEEQDELEARQALYAGQIKDIRDSQNQLEELIKRINRESRELFQATFDEVRTNFQELFRKLFGGGRADILLTDEEDVLESGIEIVARPPGKELRNLSLLSGGEKTMTALGLLFSIFKCKPSPFCLLDEVDAALDEANTERFSNLLKDFTEYSQFVVISHAKRTMSMASVLYGVTMQEAGVSKRISVRFEDAEKHLDKDLQSVGA